MVGASCRACEGAALSKVRTPQLRANGQIFDKPPKSTLMGKTGHFIFNSTSLSEILQCERHKNYNIVCQCLGVVVSQKWTSRSKGRIGKGLVCVGLDDCSPLAGPSGCTDHRLGRSPCSPSLVFPGLGDRSPPRRPSRQCPRPRHTSLGGQGVMLRRWSVLLQGPARGAAVFKARAPQHGVTRGLAQAVVDASRRAYEECCTLQGPGTPAKGDGESFPGTGHCLLKGLRVGLQCPRPGHPSPGGQGVVPRCWSVHHEVLARGTLVSKARAHQPRRTGSPALAVVGAS